MRRLSLLICAWMFLCGDAGALEFDDWSWDEGFLGHSIDGDVFSDEEIYPGHLCTDCRDPADHPVDYAAFAYNGFFGEDAWMFGTRLGIPFRIYNGEMQWVVVWFEDFLFDGLSFLPGTMEVHVRLPTGEIIVITVLKSGPDLPVGAPETGPEAGTCGCSGGGAEDDDYSEPDEFELPELDEPTGTVDIIDPDEDGEFPEWEEEL